MQALLDLGRQNGLHKEMDRIEEYFGKVKARHGTAVDIYLGFDTMQFSNLKFIGGSDKYLGEVNP